MKAKIALAKAPHLIAKAKVAKEIKAKVKIAAAASLAAAKAKKIAALSILTAPIRVAKKAIGIKIAGVKALKVAKAAKLAKVGQVVANLKKSPIILPVKVAVPFPVPIKKGPLKAAAVAGLGLGGAAGLGLGGAAGLGLGGAAALKPAAAAVGALTAPLKGIFAGATSALTSLGGIVSRPLAVPAPNVVLPAPIPPVYRFVPEVGFTNYNTVSYQPRVEVEVPVVPHATYGVPAL